MINTIDKTSQKVEKLTFKILTLSCDPQQSMQVYFFFLFDIT